MSVSAEEYENTIKKLLLNQLNCWSVEKTQMWKWSADSYSSGFWTYNIMVLRQGNDFTGLKSKPNLPKKLNWLSFSSYNDNGPYFKTNLSVMVVTY